MKVTLTPNTITNHTECFMKTFFLMWNTFIQRPLKSTERETERIYWGIADAVFFFPAFGTECVRSTQKMYSCHFLLLCGHLKFILLFFLSFVFLFISFLLLSLHFLADFDCSDPLGMESGEITSDQIIASSQYNPSWSPERSRLNYYENAWTPAEDSNKEWIQVILLMSYRGNYSPITDDCFLKCNFSGGKCLWKSLLLYSFGGNSLCEAEVSNSVPQWTEIKNMVLTEGQSQSLFIERRHNLALVFSCIM